MYVVRWALCPIGGANLTEEDKTRVTVRLDPVNELHLSKVMKATGLNQTGAVKLGLKLAHDHFAVPSNDALSRLFEGWREREEQRREKL